MLIDVHNHLQRVEDDRERERIIRRAEEAEVAMITCCHDSSDPYRVEKTAEVAEEHENVFPAFGLYYFGGERLEKIGMRVNEDVIERSIGTIREKAQEENCVAGIGEVGLAYNLAENAAQEERQREIFKKFVDLSGGVDLPLIVHSSGNSVGDVIQILKKKDRPAVLHGFQGSVEQAKEVVSLGCLIAIWPKITYSKYLQNLVEQLPLESLAFETDSPLPYNPVIPGITRTEPVHIAFTADKISEIKNVEADEVEKTMEKTAADFFDLHLSNIFE